MHMDGPDGSLELSLLGYQYPGLVTEPFDSNWLHVRVAVRHPRGDWVATDPCLLTYEAVALADWLEAAAAGREGDAELDFLEPCLRFELRGPGVGGRALRVHFEHELRPPWARVDVEADAYLDLSAAPEVLAVAADALRAQVARYPQRAAG